MCSGCGTAVTTEANGNATGFTCVGTAGFACTDTTGFACLDSQTKALLIILCTLRGKPQSMHLTGGVGSTSTSAGISTFAETCSGAEMSTVFFLRARRFLGSAGASEGLGKAGKVSGAIDSGARLGATLGCTVAASRALRLISAASAWAWAILSAATRSFGSTILPGAVLGVGRLGVNIGA